MQRHIEVIMTKSMTEGRPLKLILSFALPLLAGNIFQQLYNLVDAAIVGKTLGTEALASVGASSSVQFLVLGFCIGICGGFSIPIAQCFGAKDMRGVRSYIFHGAALTVIFALVITSLCAIFCRQILYLLRTPQQIFDGAYAYLFVLFLGIPCTLLYNLLAGILRAIGDSRTPFLFLAFSTVLNIFLDFFCILVLGWGCAGASIATVTSQGVSGLLCLIYMLKKYDNLHLTAVDRVWDSHRAKMAIIMGVPMGLQYSITAIGSMIMQSANNSLGTVYVSGFTAGLKIKQFAMCPFDALSTGVSTFASQNYGAKRPDRIRQGIAQGMAVGILYGVAIGAVLIFFGRGLCTLLVATDSANSSEVLDAAGKYLRCLGFFYWDLGILNVCRMSMQGLGFSGRTILSGTIEMLARSVVSIFFVPIYGFNAICFADQAAWFTSSIYVAVGVLWCIKRVEKMFANSL